VSQIVSQTAGGQVGLQSSTGRNVLLTFNALANDLIVNLNEQVLPDIRVPARTDNPIMTGQVLQGFTVAPRQATTGAMVTTHAQPIDIEVTIDPQAVSNAGSRPDLVRLGRVDPATGRIVVLPTTVEGNRVRAQTRQTSTFVVVAMIIPADAATDWPLDEGHQFTQTAASEFAVRAGYPIEDLAGGPQFWSTWQRWGGLPILGYPVSQVFLYRGLPVQVLQKGVVQWWPGQAQPQLVNVLDDLSRAGLDAMLEAEYQIPPPRSTAEDTGLPWREIVTRHLAIFDEDVAGLGAIRARYEETAAQAGLDPIQLWGLPLSVKDYGPFVVLRTQRVAFQYWKVALPAMGPEYVPGFVAIINSGDIAKALGYWPEEPLLPLLIPVGAQGATAAP
jgi:hypothetical protein